MSFLSCADLYVGFLISYFGGQSSLWGAIFLVSRLPGTDFLMILLYGASLSVGCLFSCLGVSLPVSRHFSQ